MIDKKRLLNDGEIYTADPFNMLVVSEGKNQKIIISEETVSVHVILAGESCEVVCHGENCCITTLTDPDEKHKVEITGRFNTVICSGRCLVNVTGNANDVIAVGPYPSIRCSGIGCTVSGALDAAEVIFTDSVNCTAESNDSIAYLAPGEGTKVIVNQVAYTEGDDLAKGKFYEIIDGNLTEVREDGMSLDDE